MVLNKFFRDLANGTLGGEDLSFNLVYTAIRRRHMLNRFVASGVDKEHGLKILNNVAV